MIHENIPHCATLVSEPRFIGDVICVYTVLSILNHALCDQTDHGLKHIGKRYARVPITIPHWIKVESPVDIFS